MRRASRGVVVIALALLVSGVAGAQSGRRAEAAGPVIGPAERAVARVAESQQTPLDPLARQARGRGVRKACNSWSASG